MCWYAQSLFHVEGVYYISPPGTFKTLFQCKTVHAKSLQNILPCKPVHAAEEAAADAPSDGSARRPKPCAIPDIFLFLPLNQRSEGWVRRRCWGGGRREARFFH